MHFTYSSPFAIDIPLKVPEDVPQRVKINSPRS